MRTISGNSFGLRARFAFAHAPFGRASLFRLMRLWRSVEHALQHLVAALGCFRFAVLIIQFFRHSGKDTMAHHPVPSDQKFDPQFAAIGRLVETWAQLEFHIDQAIWQLAQVEQMFGACITAQMIGVNGRLRALRSLLQVWGASEATVKAVGRFAGSLSDLQQKRHRAAHDPRLVNWSTGKLERLEITADNKLVFGFEPEDAESLKGTREKIAAKIEEFKILFATIAAEVNSLLETSPPKLRRIVPMRDDANPTNGT